MLTPTAIRFRATKSRFCAVLIAAALAATGCSSEAAPSELPFSETTIPADDRLETESVEDSGAAASNGAEGAEVSEVFSGVGRDPDVAECQDKVFAEAGITEVDDLSDFAAQSAQLSQNDQQRLADCVNPS